MKIKTYTTTSDNAEVNKLLSNEVEIDVNLLNDTEIIAPLIVLSGAIPTFNYVYIPDFKRYYYADRPLKRNKDTFAIQLHTDRLMSFKQNIYNSFGIIRRSENIANNYHNDGSWQTDVRKTTHIINFGGGFNDDPEYILMTCGDTL